MKHKGLYITILIFLSFQTIFGQPKSNLFVNKAVIYSPSGKYIKASNFSTKNEKTFISDEELKIDEYSISKYSKKDKELWTKNISLPNNYLNLTEIKFDSKENIYLIGNFFERNGLKVGFYLIKMNKLGKVIWTKTFIHSMNLNTNKFSSIIYLTPKNELILISKAYPKIKSDFAQLNIYKFSSNGDIISKAAAQVSKKFLGTSIDKNGNIFLLGSKNKEGKACIDYIVNISDVKIELKNIESNDFIVDDLDFDVSNQNVKNVELQELNLFCNHTSYSSLNLSYTKCSKSILIKYIFKDNLESQEANPNLFNSMEASISNNLWKDQRNISSTTDFSGDLIFRVKNSSEKSHNNFSYYKEITKGIQKVKSKTYQIKNLELLLYKVVQIQLNLVINPEVFE